MEYDPQCRKEAGTAAMRQEILELLEEIFPEIDFESSSALVDEKVLSSLSVVTIVAELCAEYGINIHYDDVCAENFNSVDAIAALVERLTKKRD